MNVFDNIKGKEHAVCESSRLKATIAGHMYDLKCHEDLDNGSVVSVGELVEMQVFNSKAYTPGETAVLILTTPIGYNSDRKLYTDEKYFYNATGEIARGYELYKDDIYALTAAGFTSGEPKVGSFIDAARAVTEEEPASGFVGEIIGKVVNGTTTKYYVKVKDLNKQIA